MRLGIKLFSATVFGLGAILIGCTTAAPQPTPAATQPPATTIPVVQPTTAPTRPSTPTAAPTHASEPATRPPSTTGAPTQAATGTQSTATAPPDVTITYEDFEIVPPVIHILAGTKVVFLIKGAPGSYHQPYNTEGPNRFEAPFKLGNGASYAYTFKEPGMVTIRCGYHPDMVATVIVVR
jgi:plastocyanin